MEQGEGIKASTSDRRLHPRVPCEIADSNGGVIRNLSLSGAYLESRSHYSPNQKIPLVFSLPPKKTRLPLSARVIHSGSVNGSRKVGYGLVFENLESTTLKELSQFLLGSASSGQNLPIIKGEKFRQVRYGVDFLRDLKSCCLVAVGEKKSEGTIQNFSKYGAAVLFETPLECNQGGVLSDVQLLLEDREIFRGSAILRHHRPIGARYEYGFLFCDRSLDLTQAFAIKEFALTRANLLQFREKIDVAQQVKPEFKIALNDFHHVLESLKKRLETVSARLSGLMDPSKKGDLEAEVLELLDSQFRRKVHDQMGVMEKIVSNYSPEERQPYIQYCRDMLLGYFHDAPFIKRAFHKPLGYPGDYETMNMIYEGRYAGDNLWQKTANNLFWTLPTNQAVRNRSRYLAGKICEVVAGHPNDQKNIMSLACGPCKEIQFVMTDPADPLARSKEVSFHLIDHDPHALTYVNDVFGGLNLTRRNKVGWNAYQISVANFIKNPENREKIPSQDLIYVSGLFDYLSDEIAELLIGILYFMLKPGGRLIVGNFSPFNPYRLAQEFALDWFLIYRDEKVLKNLISKSLKCSDVLVEEEPTHINLFLNLARS